MTDRPRTPGRLARLARGLGRALLAVVLLAGFAVELLGGQYGIPTWGQLHAWLGVPLRTAPAVPLDAGQTAVSVLDVGQGDAVLIAQDGEYCLIDAGTAESAAQLCAALQQAGVGRLKLLVLTHPHADHCGGMAAVLDTLPVDGLLLPPAPGGQQSPVCVRLCEQADRAGVPVLTAETGAQYAVGGGMLEVLQADFAATPQQAEDDPNAAENNASLCLRFTAGGFSFLDTGDAEAAAEQALVDTYGGRLQSVLLKAGHHGSSTSTTAALLQAVSPQAVAISCGRGNEYGHPHDAVLQRLAESSIPCARTDEQGTLTWLWQDGALTLLASGAPDAVLPAA